jgi:hypothetical protein
MKDVRLLKLILPNRKMTLYTLVKRILVEDEEARDSDKALIWRVLEKKGLLRSMMDGDRCIYVLAYSGLQQAPTLESITRARRKVQEQNPELAGSQEVKIRREKMSQGHPIDMFENM